MAMKRPTQNLSLSRYEFAYNRFKIFFLCFRLHSFSILARAMAQCEKSRSLAFPGKESDLAPSSTDISRWDLNEPLQPPQPAGAALLLDVIEHCENPGLALRNIASVMQENGRLIVTVPNPRWSRSRIHALFCGYPTCFGQSDLDLNHHVFTPWPHILQRLLEDVGFTIDRYVTLDGKTEIFRRNISLTYPVRCFAALANKIINSD